MPLSLKEARKKAGLTQVELCRKIGIYQPDLSNYERGHTVPSGKVRKDIKDVLGVETIDWYSGEEDLNTNEVYEMCETLKVVSRRIGYRKALELLSSLSPDMIRTYVASLHPDNEEKLFPPGIEKNKK